MIRAKNSKILVCITRKAKSKTPVSLTDEGRTDSVEYIKKTLPNDFPVLDINHYSLEGLLSIVDNHIVWIIRVEVYDIINNHKIN